MSRVYVGLGSNVDREKRLREALDLLRLNFGDIEMSPVYDSAAVGFDGSNFLNLVVGFDSPLEVEEVAKVFREIEDQLGRDRSLPKFTSRSIDLDILLYGDRIVDVPGIRIPRPEILINAFVLKPLQDIAPQRLHPETEQSFADHWQVMAPNAPPLELFPLDF
jgi:2-amino-4-hydroxy-6-hydroxymethyldihydropteridine diphosphokinase